MDLGGELQAFVGDVEGGWVKPIEHVVGAGLSGVCAEWKLSIV